MLEGCVKINGTSLAVHNDWQLRCITCNVKARHERSQAV